MLGAADKITLFGRFRLATRAEITARVRAVGASTIKDLTRATTVFVVGSGAVNLVADGRLSRRLAEARSRGTPIWSEAKLLRTMEGNGGAETPIGLARFPGISTALADLLCAFDLIALDQDQVRFSDADILSNASELVAEGLEPLEILRALTARRAAPTGRHRLAADEHGKPVLAWDDGLTTLSGQGLLPLDEKDGLEAAFEQAMEAEFAGRFDEAIRLYESCIRADKADAIAPFNLGNVHLRQGDLKQAAVYFETALRRDGAMAEASFNLAVVFDRMGEADKARQALEHAIDIDPDYPDPRFNLAQLHLEAGDAREARRHFEAFVRLSDDEELKRKAAKALHLLA